MRFFKGIWIFIKSNQLFLNKENLFKTEFFVNFIISLCVNPLQAPIWPHGTGPEKKGLNPEKAKPRPRLWEDPKQFAGQKNRFNIAIFYPFNSSRMGIHQGNHFSYVSFVQVCFEAYHQYPVHDNILFGECFLRLTIADFFTKVPRIFTKDKIHNQQ